VILNSEPPSSLFQSTIGFVRVCPSSHPMVVDNIQVCILVTVCCSRCGVRFYRPQLMSNQMVFRNHVCAVDVTQLYPDHAEIHPTSIRCSSSRPSLSANRDWTHARRSVAIGITLCGIRDDARKRKDRVFSRRQGARRAPNARQQSTAIWRCLSVMVLHGANQKQLSTPPSNIMRKYGGER